MKISVFWFRRDLRLEDNVALNKALNSGLPVLPIFIFDKNILTDLPRNDARVGFIHDSLKTINDKLSSLGKSLKIYFGKPIEVWEQVIKEYEVSTVYINEDYEPYAIVRDSKIKSFLEKKEILFYSFKDHVIHEKNEILKKDGTPYTVYTPYSKKWKEKFYDEGLRLEKKPEIENFLSFKEKFPELEDIGFERSPITVKPYDLSQLDNYDEYRNLPAIDATSYLSPHLRFGTISVRQIISKLKPENEVFLNELIWREFFIQILYHFPQVVTNNFKSKYSYIQWRNNEEEYKKWCEGNTGYPLVDAGMRQLNETGYMHNRVRMVTASFLCKHLLIDWKWGEAYFAEKLLDYELASNNGNWQWVAGTGCDAAPYFRVFNPSEQLKKFDRKLEYVKKWVPKVNTFDYPLPMVDHKFARQRALETYKVGLQSVDQ